MRFALPNFELCLEQTSRSRSFQYGYYSKLDIFPFFHPSISGYAFWSATNSDLFLVFLLNDIIGAELDLESRVDAAKALTDLPPQELIHELSALLAKMTKSLADATGSIPSYDQKQFEIVGILLQSFINEQTKELTFSFFFFSS